MDVEQSVQAMLQELRQTAELGSQIQHKLDSSQQQLNTWRETVESLLASVTQEIAHTEQNWLQHREELLQQMQTLVSGTIVPMTETVSNGHEEINHWHEQAMSMIEAITQISGDFHTTVESTRDDLHQRIQTVASAVGDVQNQIKSEFEESRQGIQNLADFVSRSHDDWQGFVQETGEQLQTARQECQTQLDSHFFQPMESCLEQFNELISKVSEDTLAHPITALKEQASQAIDQEITQVFNQSFEELKRLMDEMMDKISGASDKNSVERQALHEIFKVVEQLFHPIKEKVESVQALGKPLGFF